MAGGIRKKDRVGWIGGDSYQREPEPISYCPHCRKHGLYEKLGSRILKPGEVMSNEEYEKWRQCTGCGMIFPIYETKIESKVQDFVETSDNPFDQGKTILGNDNKKRSKRSDMQKLKERIEREKDSDIKRELRMGHTVEIIEDGTEQAYLS
jgi:hypothetical protein